MDLKSTFLNGTLQKFVYIEQPVRYIIEGIEDKVHILNKVWYGLKHAPRIEDKVYILNKVWYGLKHAPRVWLKRILQVIQPKPKYYHINVFW